MVFILIDNHLSDFVSDFVNLTKTFSIFADENERTLNKSAEQNDDNDLRFFENADELLTSSNGTYLASI